MTSTTKRQRRVIAAALLLTSLVAGGCSDGDDRGGGEGGRDGASGDAVRIEDFTFKPGELRVDAGTTVTFTNVDEFAHTATATDKSFDTGNLEQDGTFEHTFDEAGTYEYLCAIHNSMTGTITVT